MMHKVTPTPQTWTLRFKHHRTTILIEVDKLQDFSDVRTELLQAIQDTNPSGQLNGHTIPKNPDDIILGLAVDRNRLPLGYTSLAEAANEEGTSSKGKGKSAAGSSAKSLNKLKDSPEGVGLRNGDVVAFKFMDEADEEWDVMIPTLEETYGDDDEGIGMDGEG